MGMVGMFLCAFLHKDVGKTGSLIFALAGALFASFSIGAFFSVGYTVPSHLAQIEYETKGISVSSMYFAVQGLIEGIASGIATGVVLTAMKTSNAIEYMPLVAMGACLVALGMSFGLPKSISLMGKQEAPQLEPNK